MSQQLLGFVKDAAIARGDPTVSDEHILAALQKAENGEAQIERYPNGMPALKDIYKLAVEIEKTNSTTH